MAAMTRAPMMYMAVAIPWKYVAVENIVQIYSFFDAVGQNF
jgi:hypothetical protein